MKIYPLKINSQGETALQMGKRLYMDSNSDRHLNCLEKVAQLTENLLQFMCKESEKHIVKKEKEKKRKKNKKIMKQF